MPSNKLPPAFCASLAAVVEEEAREQGVAVRSGGTVVTIQGPRCHCRLVIAQ